MKIEQAKVWMDVIAPIVTILALIVGGGFGAYQYLGQAHDGQVKETLNFLDRFNRAPVAEARARLQEVWSKYDREEKTTVGKDYDAFLLRVVVDEHLKVSVAVLNDFYEALEVCSQNQICDQKVTLALFQEGACSFFNRHYPFIASERLISGDRSLGRGTELFAADIKGADTVTCVKRSPK